MFASSVLRHLRCPAGTLLAWWFLRAGSTKILSSISLRHIFFHILSNVGGSTNSEIFAEFLLQCVAKPARELIPMPKPIVVVMDSGGGSFLHSSPRVLQICLQHGLRPFYLPAWTTVSDAARSKYPLDHGQTLARVPAAVVIPASSFDNFRSIESSGGGLQ